MNKIYLIIFFLLFICIEGDAKDNDLPIELQRLGKKYPVYNSMDLSNVDENHPIFQYKLNDENIETMAAQYAVAQAAKKMGQDILALSILWDLAENGYAPANLDMAIAFSRKPKLGMRYNHDLSCIFINRPKDIIEMRGTQEAYRRCLNRRNIYLADQKLSGSKNLNEPSEEKKAESEKNSLSLADINIGEEYNPLLETGIRKRKN